MTKERNLKDKEYIFIDKSLFFPEKGILVIGDLHIGYEESLVESGILVPEQQVADAIEDMKKIIMKIDKEKYTIKKIIFLGDIKHMFGYEWKEKSNFNKVLEFLGNYVEEEDIILIRGNHDTIDYSYGNMRDYYIDGDIGFIHGHKSFPEIYDKRIKIIVSGHLHPSVIIEENPGVKHETYKCFLEGKSKGKIFIVVPSFLDFYEGTPVNYYKEEFVPSFSIIPIKDILRFNIHVIGENEVYDFGTIKNLQ